MFNGMLIDELIASVTRAEEHVTTDWRSLASRQGDATQVADHYRMRQIAAGVYEMRMAETIRRAFGTNIGAA